MNDLPRNTDGSLCSHTAGGTRIVYLSRSQTYCPTCANGRSDIIAASLHYDVEPFDCAQCGVAVMAMMPAR